VRWGGAMRSNNVGTSNRNPDARSGRRKSKVSLTMYVSQGLVGPKVMAKAGIDGHTVNIP
jgi:homoaconitase/3-isopropylmalate dehydratase large subunit